MDHKPIHEDYLAALTLRKTICFLLYAVLVPMFLMPVILHPRFTSMPEAWRNVVVVLLFAAILLALLYLVIKGIVPGSKVIVIQPFNEKQIAVGMTVLSAAVWILLGNSLAGEIIRSVVNGGLFLSTAVYFVTKSILSRRPRWAVLTVLIVPGIQLYSKLGLGSV